MTESARLRKHRSSGREELNFPTSELRGSSLEELPHLQGVAAARAQEGQEELLHVQRQEGQP